MRLPWTKLAILVALLSWPAALPAQEIRIAAAADLKFAMPDLASQFQKKTHSQVNVTYGSSGNFYSQLENGAPFDLFFSADAEYPKKLSEAGLAETDTLCTYAFGDIAIWMPANNKLDLASKKWDTLLDPSVRKIAIANPEHAPYGRAALAALKKAGLFDRLKSKLVFGEDVAQAAQFVHSGNAQAGMIPMSLVISPAMRDGQLWEIPASLYPPIEQVAVVLKNTQNKPVARMFLDFVKSSAGRDILVRNGFRLPDWHNSGAPAQ